MRMLHSNSRTAPVRGRAPPKLLASGLCAQYVHRAVLGNWVKGLETLQTIGTAGWNTVAKK